MFQALRLDALDRTLPAGAMLPHYITLKPPIMSQARGKALPQEIEYMITHYDDNRAPELVAALSINIALAIIIVILRWLARRTIRSPFRRMTG